VLAIGNEQPAKALGPNGSHEALSDGALLNRHVHRRRAVRRKPFESRIPSIRFVGGSFH
jgi:hypothetical protein